MIETARLRLRAWGEGDRPAFRALMADPGIARFLGPVAGAGADAAFDRHRGYRVDHGLGFWAVERREDGALIGQCGLKPGAPGTPIAGELEIGWAFAMPWWGQGLAIEAARATLAWGWANRPEPTIAAITAAANERSRALMERLGMAIQDGEGFDHPLLPANSPLRHHVTYRIGRPHHG